MERKLALVNGGVSRDDGTECLDWLLPVQLDEQPVPTVLLEGKG